MVTQFLELQEQGVDWKATLVQFLESEGWIAAQSEGYLHLDIPIENKAEAVHVDEQDL